jgi:hypothetical protein
MPPGLSPYPSDEMAEFQWWLLLVGLVAGGGLVAIVSMDGRRREEDLSELERRAEANWIAERLTGLDRKLDGQTVESVLRVHREYLSLPPPDRLVVEGDAVLGDAVADEGASGGAASGGAASDRDADEAPNEVRDDRGRSADQDLSRTREEQAPAREEAHAGADREQRGA